MAQFKISYPIVKQNEGGYANNPKDRGKETYCGISRFYHPNWGGWQFIDKLKQKGAIKTNTIFKSLVPLVEGFYYKEYWQKLYCAYFSQELANQLLDFAVNSGKGRATKELQKILNRFGHGLKVDGILGQKTAQAVQARDNKMLANELLKARGAFVEEEIKNQPHFASTWRKRLDYMRSFLSDSRTQVALGFAGLLAVGLIIKNM